MEYRITERNCIRRLPNRGSYDKAAVFSILDRGFLCHVGFVVGQQPFVIPMLYGREGEMLYLHGATASRLLRNLATGIEATLSVAHLDGLVLARSAFHHSINYQSAVLFGTAREVQDDDKLHALFVISEQVAPRRWQEVRVPNARELNATKVLQFSIQDASAKVRTGPPVDDAEDYALPVWAGVVPVITCYGAPQSDPLLRPGIDVPESVQKHLAPSGTTT